MPHCCNSATTERFWAVWSDWCWATQYFWEDISDVDYSWQVPVPRVNEPQIWIFAPPTDLSLTRSPPGDMTPSKNLYQNIRLYVTFISVCGDWLEIYFKGKEKILVNGFIKIIGYIFGSDRSSRCQNHNVCPSVCSSFWQKSTQSLSSLQEGIK